jgi:hypothetical protein
MLGTVGGAFVAVSWSTMAVAVWASIHDPTTLAASAATAKDAATPAITPGLDRKDAGALYEQYGLDASATCDAASDDYIRKLAKDDFKWSEGSLFGARFDKYQEIVSQPGVITLSTDKLTFANRSGYSTRAAFYCRYDTQARKVLGYEIGQ